MAWKIILWSAVTIGVFYAARRLFLRTKIQILHPVLVSTIVLLVVVEATGRRYAEFAEGTHWLAWILGPGVVAMGVPVYKLRALIFRKIGVLVTVVLSAMSFSIASTMGLLALFGADRLLMIALSMKSVTSAVAMAIAVDAGALPAVAGVGAMFAAVLGAAIGPWVLGRAGVTDPRAVGLALGCGSHAVGTARAFELGEEQGTFASVGLSLTTLAAALICPPLFLLFS
ncbi:LrgB family protein [Oleiharenicola lentus]|uniref:LrgB family protein n=1 Tax=Oleiharenicola lentus TaxID=2508720 RepID=UPI003F680768